MFHSVLSPRRDRVWFPFLSHKLDRLAVPCAMVVMLVSSVLSDGSIYEAGFWSAIALVLVGPAGLKKGIACPLRSVSASSSLLILNAAAWLGFGAWITGRAASSWAKVDYGAAST